jgi:molybdopterin/thiamine biosynthesis adenylyltransferase
MGAERLCLYDYDKVNEENLGVSQYDSRHIGKYKVNALASVLKDVNPEIDVHEINEEFKEMHASERDVAILGFDSMEARLQAVEALCTGSMRPLFIIDGRMGAEHYQQYVFKSPTVTKYKKTWYSDSNGDIEPCNRKATSYCSNMSGSFIVNAIRKVITNQPYEKEITFNFPTMMLQIK